MPSLSTSNPANPAVCALLLESNDTNGIAFIGLPFSSVNGCTPSGL